MSAAEDYRALREARKKRGFGNIGGPSPKGMTRPVAVTKCTECGKVIPFRGDKPCVCDRCWDAIHGRSQSGRWTAHL